MKLIVTFVSCLLMGHLSHAQLNMEVIGTNLLGPIGIERDPSGNLWIAESGTGSNDGAITVIWADGTQERVIDGLPSIFDSMTMETLGPYRVQFFNDKYFGILISGGIPEVGSSIAVFDRDSIISGRVISGLQTAANMIPVDSRVRQLGFRQSNVFSFVADGEDLYMTDAAANAILHRDGLTGVIKPFATFAPSVNPLPFGPPFSDAVPTRIIHNPAGGFYVSQLTGFPFLDRVSKIFSVDTLGSVSVVDSGLTLITDLALDPSSNGLLALQHANFRLDSLPPFVIGSAKIIRIGLDGSKDTLASDFGPSPGMAVAGENNFYVTNLFFGTVTHLSSMTTSQQDENAFQAHSLNVSPNPMVDHITLNWNQYESGEVILRIISLDGKILQTSNLGFFESGTQNLFLDTESLPLHRVSNQPLAFTLSSGKNFYAQSVILTK